LGIDGEGDREGFDMSVLSSSPISSNYFILLNSRHLIILMVKLVYSKFLFTHLSLSRSLYRYRSIIGFFLENFVLNGKVSEMLKAVLAPSMHEENVEEAEKERERVESRKRFIRSFHQSESREKEEIRLWYWWIWRARG